MKQDLTQNLNEVAILLSQFQKHVNALSGDAAGITHLFFDSELSIADISQIYELPTEQIEDVVRDFLVKFLAKSQELQQFLARCSLKGKKAVVAADIKGKANILIETCGIPDSIGTRVRKMIGTAIRLSIPLSPPNLYAETISKMGIAAKLRESNYVKFAPSVEDKKNFPLYFVKDIAAGAAITHIDKTPSPWTVIVKRGMEKVEVKFDIALQEIETIDTKGNTVGKYAITFHNLPSWATPASFSFVGPDHWGNIKEYELPSEFREGRLYFRIENREQKDAFINREKSLIGFVISPPSSKNNPRAIPPNGNRVDKRTKRKKGRSKSS